MKQETHHNCTYCGERFPVGNSNRNCYTCPQCQASKKALADQRRIAGQQLRRDKEQAARLVSKLIPKLDNILK